MNPEKQHDSIMNSLEWQLENATGMEWLQLANTKQYQAISKAVFEIVHGKFESED